MIDSVRASYLIFRHRCERRWRIEADRVTAAAVKVVAVPVVLLVALWWPWDTVAGWFSSITNAVKNAIVWVANQIANIIVTVVNDVWSFAGDVASGVADAVSFIGEIGNSAFGLLKTVWDTWLPDLFHMATAVAQALVDTAAHYLRIAIDQVHSFAGAILDELHSVYGWAVDNIYHPLRAFVQSAFDFVNNTILPMVAGWVDTVKRLLIDWVQHVIDTVAPVIAWFASAAAIIVRWFTDGVRFMLFVLEHPTDWWHRMADEMFQRGSDTIDNHIVSLVDRRGGDILDNLSKWVG